MTRALPWLSCRVEEWARRPGASPPMRMAASWFGSLGPPDTSLWRDDPRPKASSPRIVIPTAPSVPPCSGPSRCGLATAEHAARLVRRPTLTAPARAGVAKRGSGRRNGLPRSNKETDEGKKMRPLCLNFLTKKAPYKGHPPVLTSPNPLSTLHRRFACARLSQPRLPGSCPDFSATFTTIAFDDSSLRWLEINT